MAFSVSRLWPTPYFRVRLMLNPAVAGQHPPHAAVQRGSFHGQSAPEAGLIIESLDQHQRCDASETSRVRTLVDRARCPSGWRGFFGREARTPAFSASP